MGPSDAARGWACIAGVQSGTAKGKADSGTATDVLSQSYIPLHTFTMHAACVAADLVRGTTCAQPVRLTWRTCHALYADVSSARQGLAGAGAPIAEGNWAASGEQDSQAYLESVKASQRELDAAGARPASSSSRSAAPAAVSVPGEDNGAASAAGQGEEQGSLDSPEGSDDTAHLGSVDQGAAKQREVEAAAKVAVAAGQGPADVAKGLADVNLNELD